MSTAQTATDIRPFQVDTPEEKLAELRRRIADAPAFRGAGPRSVAGRAIGHDSGTRTLLGDRL
jgi:hypothetical protein